MTNAQAQLSGPESFLRDPSRLNMPWIESPFFETCLEAMALDPLRKEQARSYHDRGYLVIENLFEPAAIDAVVGRYEWLFNPRTVFKAPADTVQVLTRDPNRRQDAWFVSPEIKRLACHPKILELLAFLYGRPAIPFQTLDFLCGSQQPLHSDAIHFSCIPARFMCGVWVALEDVTLENGPLMYAEGSHALHDRQLFELGLWPKNLGGALGDNYAQYEDYIRAITTTGSFPLKRLTCRKGTALIWASNLLHGGSPITKPGATRMSQVTHYYFENCIYYTPVYSNPPIGQIYLRDIYDIHRERRMQHMLNGSPLPEKVLAPMRQHYEP